MPYSDIDFICAVFICDVDLADCGGVTSSFIKSSRFITFFGFLPLHFDSFGELIAAEIQRIMVCNCFLINTHEIDVDQSN